MDLSKLDDYTGALPHIERTHGHTLDVFVADETPRTGSTVRLTSPGEQDILARVTGHIKGRVFGAHVLHDLPSWVEFGVAVSLEPSILALPRPTEGTLDLHDVNFVTSSAHTLSLSGTSPDRPHPPQGPLELGIEALDIMTPFVPDGTNLIVDASGQESATTRIRERALEALAPDHVVALNIHGDADTPKSSGPGVWHHILSPPTTFGWFYALRGAMSWVEHLRDQGHHVVFLVRLPILGDPQTFNLTPAPESRLNPTHRDIVDTIGSRMVSTDKGRCTSVLHLPLAPVVAEASILMDTVSFGDVDAQIVIRPDDTYAPHYSTSKIAFDPTDQRHLKRKRILRAFEVSMVVADKLAIFGSDECEPEELELLKLAKQYERVVIESKG